MADISIEEARAKQWVADVNYELEAVRSVLSNVSNALQTAAGEDDSIMQGIYKVGTAMQTVWTNMCNKFTEAQGIVGEAVSVIAEGANTVLDLAGQLARLFI